MYENDTVYQQLVKSFFTSSAHFWSSFWNNQHKQDISHSSKIFHLKRMAFDCNYA